MKKLWSKNLFIGILLTVNAAGAAFVALHGKQLRAMIARTGIHKSPRSPASLMPAKANVLTPNVSLRNDDKVQACYQSYLASQPTVEEGQVIVHWQVGKEGDVRGLTLVHSDLPDDSFTSCILERLRDLRYQTSKAGAIVAHKFNFRRKDATDIHF